MTRRLVALALSAGVAVYALELSRERRQVERTLARGRAYAQARRAEIELYRPVPADSRPWNAPRPRRHVHVSLGRLAAILAPFLLAAGVLALAVWEAR